MFLRRTCLIIAGMTLGNADRSYVDSTWLKWCRSGKSPMGRWCTRCTCRGEGSRGGDGEEVCDLTRIYRNLPDLILTRIECVRTQLRLLCTPNPLRGSPWPWAISLCHSLSFSPSRHPSLAAAHTWMNCMWRSSSSFFMPFLGPRPTSMGVDSCLRRWSISSRCTLQARSR